MSLCWGELQFSFQALILHGGSQSFDIGIGLDRSIKSASTISSLSSLKIFHGYRAGQVTTQARDGMTKHGKVRPASSQCHQPLTAPPLSSLPLLSNLTKQGRIPRIRCVNRGGRGQRKRLSQQIRRGAAVGSRMMHRLLKNAQCLKEKSDLQFAAVFVCRGIHGWRSVCLKRAVPGPDLLPPRRSVHVSICMCSSLLYSRSRLAGRVNSIDSVFQLPASGF